MTYIPQKITTPWTEKHEQFCYEEKIPPAAKILWQWLLRHGNLAEESEPDLTEFNNWVAKCRGRGYAHEYLKKMFEVLVSKRVINLLKDFSWKCKRILLKPLEWLKPLKKKAEKNLQNPNISCKTDPSNPTESVEGVNSSSNSNSLDQQHLEEEHQRQQEVLTLCAEHDIYFNPEKKPEILTYSVEEIQSAIKHFYSRGGHESDNQGNKKIPNPEGWLIRCLQYSWWEDADFGVNEFVEAMSNFYTKDTSL